MPSTIIISPPDSFGMTNVIILSGAGRMFSAGADIAGWKSPGHPDDHDTPEGSVAIAIHRCSKPTIVVLHGAAVGVGITIALPCVIRIATKDTKIAFPFAKRGLIMEACSSYFLPRIVGAGRTLRLVMTGETALPTDPKVDGLFDEIADTKEEAMEKAQMLAREISEGSPTFLEGCRRLVYSVESPEDAHVKKSRVLQLLRNGPDQAEGFAAFLEKREP